MNKKLQSAGILLLSLLVFSSSNAQTSEKPMAIELNGGYREYLGDLGSSLFFGRKPNYQGAGLNFGYYLNPVLDAVFNVTGGDLGFYQTIDYLNPLYKFQGFKANTLDATIGARIKLPALADAKVMQYIHVAFGGYYIHSKAVLVPNAVTDMGANVQGGLGVSWRITPSWGMRWSWTANYTMNDRWDGSNGQDTSAPLVHKLFRTNDLYSHHALGITYSFGSGNGPAKLKDKDGDGVPDKYDLCKETEERYWQYVDSNGCPMDTDKDGILDGDDACRLVAGKKEFNGCPDTDGDGIQDSKDECPKIAGLAQFNGCPDTDGDGIQDNKDECPKIAGLAKFNGCPDTDGDGIQDNKDKCPNVAGAPEGEGCPDTDGDGVYDNIDKCPSVPGVKELKGCPEIKKEVIQKIALAAKGINFESGKAIILANSFTNLDNLAKILNEYPEANVEIQGHTDNSGDHDKNVTLSQDRADAVKAYLGSHGITTERMNAIGFGPDQPIVDNSTDAGRAKNRRVDFKLIY